MRVGRVEAEVRQDRVDFAVVELAGAVAVETVEGLEDVLGDVLARLRLVWLCVVVVGGEAVRCVRGVSWRASRRRVIGDDGEWRERREERVRVRAEILEEIREARRAIGVGSMRSPRR